MEPSIALEELLSFHSIDREVFSRLVFNLRRDITQALLLMATWMLLEDMGYPSMIEKMVSLPNQMVVALANEAASILTAIESTFYPVPSNGGLPLHASFMKREITLHYFIRNKYTVISGIRNYLNTVCERIFVDIIQQRLGMPLQRIPLRVHGFPHHLFGDVDIRPRPISFGSPSVELWGWNSSSNVTQDDRTLFLTFSRGFHVSAEEVKEFFTTKFGKCVQSIHMQEPPRNGQCLYAKLVLVSVSLVDQVLEGHYVAKYIFKGKHIWARKYERRD